MGIRSFSKSSSKSREKMPRAARAACGVAVLVAALAGAANGESGCAIRELFKEGGWDIPGLPGATVQGRSAAGQNGELLVEALTPGSPAASVMMVTCAPGDPERILIRDQAVNVQKLQRVSMQGRTFAYRVAAEDVGVDRGARVALGSSEILMYYDLDGSGLFKLREYASSVPYKFRVPDWVKAARSGIN